MTARTPETSLFGLVKLISNDSLAADHQSVSSYREMLLQGASRALERLGVSEPGRSDFEAQTRFQGGPVRTGKQALFLGGAKHGQIIDLADLRSTFVEFESLPHCAFASRDDGPEDRAVHRVVYQLHRYPGPEGRAFYVDTRIENPATLIKQHL